MLDKLKMEFLGSFMIFLVLGMTIVNLTYDAVTINVILLSSFSVMSTTLWISKHLCDCHFNPAITLSHIITKHIDLITGASYIIVQFLAGIFAASIIKIAIPIDLYSKVQETSLLGFAIKNNKILCTFILVFAYYILKYQRNIHHAVFAPGLASIFTVIVFVAFKKTGAVFNPARIFGICFVTKNYFSNLWAYMLAPLFGGILGGLTGNFFLQESPQELTQRRMKEINRRKTVQLKKNIDDNLREALKNEDLEEIEDDE